MPTFLYPAKWTTALPSGVSGVSGSLIIPVGIAWESLSRRSLKKHKHMESRFLDPQLYLTGLNAAKCRKACANLNSYGWFSDTEEKEKFESTKHTQTEWRKKARTEVHTKWRRALPTKGAEIDRRIKICLEKQCKLGCTALILPSPLTSESSTDYRAELDWLDRSLFYSKNLGKPRFATVAIADSCLRSTEAYRNPLLDIITDQLTSRIDAGLDGVYFVIEQSHSSMTYYLSHPNTIESILRLVFELKTGGIKQVMVSFLGVAGILAGIAGADLWASGWYRGERRLSLADCEDQGGMAVPAYYSHLIATEIHVEDDLDNINEEGLLELVRDETPFSNGLLRALEASRKVANVPEWRYNMGNVKTARAHYFNVMLRETEILTKLDQKGRIAYGKKWLKTADDNSAIIRETLDSVHDRTELDHQSVWNTAFQDFCKTNQI